MVASSNKNQQQNQRIQNTREDADRYRDGLKAKNVLTELIKMGNTNVTNFSKSANIKG